MENTVARSSSESKDTVSPWKHFMAGVVEMLPLCLSVVPWGILAGSMAIQSGLSVGQSIGMSAIIFAGAAQLVSLGLLMSGANVATLLISVFFITAQHLIYGLTLREYVSTLKLRKRLPIGFLLSDELFALSEKKDRKNNVSTSYLIGAGFTFYIFWNIFSILGVLMASSVPDLDKYHLDYSIVATFITIVVPMIKKISTFSGVLFSLLLSMLLTYFKVEGAIAIAGVGGMFFSVFIASMLKEEK
ncbi:AzlC family ABC transporter permease [Pectobacterium brasiliense]|uniref:AzlC family ABC transporter permease n=1 Tax=Pectobacterium brasiliense TaxID=180957 RepID=UPI00196919E7|nr:AzlC family ABC transporter permease [Pectobacterium brasiliense]MBN3162073.1 AzlC family ABC transporter permease [Pectobacterium brasiliense]